jgi:hypothetical protein
MLPPGASLHRRDLRVIKAQVQPADQLPDQTRAMIFVDQLFDVDAAQHKLLSIDGGKSRFSRHAVVAHTRSLQILPHKAMPLLGRKTISSRLPDSELCRPLKQARFLRSCVPGTAAAGFRMAT